MPVPGHGALSARAQTNGYVQTRACARAPYPGTKSEQDLIIAKNFPALSKNR